MRAMRPSLQFEVPEFRLGPSADINALVAPIMEGVKRGDQLRKDAFSEQMEREKLDLQKQAAARSAESHEAALQEARIKRIGGVAQAIDAMPDGPERQAAWARLVQSHPNFGKTLEQYGVPSADHLKGPKFLVAQALGPQDPLERAQKEAAIAQSQAHAAYYKGRADLDQKERWKLDPSRNVMVNSITGETRPIAGAGAPAKADPLEGAGLDEDGNIVAGGSAAAPSAPPTYGPGQGDTWQLQPQGPGRFAPPMRLGAPMDDIDRSMRVDEGRPEAKGVQVAQAPAPWKPDPSQMDQAAARMFGPVGTTSPEVPGIITDAGKNRRTDVPATREYQGQKAVESATPEQQERLRRFREEQEKWAWVYKRQPRAGYYYGTDGREMPLSDKNYKGDKETQAQVLMNMQKIDQATKKLLEPGIAGAVTPGGVGDYLTRSIAGQANVGETGQAFADLKQAALGIAYALSGKQVAVAEMKNFIDSYGPQPWDSEWRIRTKAERMKEFYGTLLSAVRGGQDYDKAFAAAMAKMGVKNPDGTPAGAPAAASAGAKPAEDLSKLPTEELWRRLPGAR